jgi:hypothetical protein
MLQLPQRLGLYLANEFAGHSAASGRFINQASFNSMQSATASTSNPFGHVGTPASAKTRANPA